MFKNLRAKARHKQLMRLADEAIRDADSLARRTKDGRPDVTPADLAARAFGRYGVQLGLDEAVDYLDAAFAQRGYRPTGANRTA